MKTMIIVFIALVIIMLVGGHLVLYSSWTSFLNITNKPVQRVILITLLVLSLSFMATMGLVHWRENFFTSNLYFIASSWLGIVWNIMLATIVVWIAVGVANAFHVRFNATPFAIALLIISLGYSAYGFWSAQTPRITRITVTIPNLPASWDGRTAVQLSDVHLGAIHHIKFARKVINRVNSLKPDIVFVTGDVYDGAGKQLGLLIAPFKDLEASLGSYYIIGNHETYVGLDTVFAALKESPFTILRDEVADIDGVQVLGIDYPLPGKKHDAGPALQKLEPDKPSIVLYHEPRRDIMEQIKSRGVNLVISGHTHKGQMWPFGFITKAMYREYDVGWHQDGTFNSYTSTGVGTWGPPLRTGTRSEIVEITFRPASGN
ncbi:MAG: metallophosphoesterase [Patescibacteria group bacterium]|nr:metallophosphoesterase [Patescibacteria group bacterium]